MTALGRTFEGPRRPYATGLAALAVTLGLFCLPPVRAAADELLSIFRVQRVVFENGTRGAMAFGVGLVDLAPGLGINLGWRKIFLGDAPMTIGVGLSFER